MAIKGTVIKQDHIPVNKYRLDVVNAPLPLVFTKISGIDEELEVVELPDRTVQTGGRTKTIEFEATQPLHHFAERHLLEAWLQEAIDPVSPNYKKIGVLTLISQTGDAFSSYQLGGLFPSKRALPDFELGNEGDMAEVTWTFKADELVHII